MKMSNVKMPDNFVTNIDIDIKINKLALSHLKEEINELEMKLFELQDSYREIEDTIKKLEKLKNK